MTKKRPRKGKLSVKGQLLQLRRRELGAARKAYSSYKKKGKPIPDLSNVPHGKRSEAKLKWWREVKRKKELLKDIKPNLSDLEGSSTSRVRKHRANKADREERLVEDVTAVGLRYDSFNKAERAWQLRMAASRFTKSGGKLNEIMPIIRAWGKNLK